MAMNKWVKRKWVRALRSGEYGKGARQLGYVNEYDPAEYCCLGVLVCEMAPEFVEGVNGNIHVGDADTDTSMYLPDDLAIMYGLDHDTQRRLARINDDANTFAPVIDYIEANL